MRTEEETMILIAKFDMDVATKPRWLRALIAFDQLCGVIFWNNSNDETISSRIARKQEAGESSWFEDRLCCILSKLEYNHCKVSKGE